MLTDEYRYTILKAPEKTVKVKFNFSEFSLKVNFASFFSCRDPHFTLALFKIEQVFCLATQMLFLGGQDGSGPGIDSYLSGGMVLAILLCKMKMTLSS